MNGTAAKDSESNIHGGTMTDPVSPGATQNPGQPI